VIFAEVQMRETIEVGRVLIKDGILLPDSLTIESELYSPGWRSVAGLDGHAMDRKMHDAGWILFFLAGEIGATAFGREGQKTVHRAVKKILAGLKSGNFNSIEITRVEFKHFLGVPYAKVSFHLRNLQQGMFLSARGNSRAWKDETLVAA
jgi:hypothetical protein